MSGLPVYVCQYDDLVTDPRRAVGLATAAAFLGMCKSTVRSRIEDGRLPAWKDGKIYRIRIVALVKYRRDVAESS